MDKNNKTLKQIKKISWADDVYVPQIKRQCECLCCFGCNTNTQCIIFGPHICKKCNEWRCNKCCNDHICKNCKKEY